jgi:penicillin-binding protein activator
LSNHCLLKYSRFGSATYYIPGAWKAGGAPIKEEVEMVKSRVIKKVWIIIAVIAVAAMTLGASGCAKRTVDRLDEEQVVDISGRWNDTDSRLVSEEMIQDALNRPWLGQFTAVNRGVMPTVIVGSVRNHSHEHINVQTFVKDLERALINSGRIEFVASSDQRGEVREERRDQSEHSREDTVKPNLREIGADFMLTGTINSIRDKHDGREVIMYQVNMELIEIETHRKVWIGEKKIRKFIQQRRFGL